MKFLNFLLLLFPLNAQAGIPVDAIVTNCKTINIIEKISPTPTIFKHGNNLMQVPGSFAQARGEKITILGRVMDKKCQLVKGAVVQIWHANSHGEYQIEKINYEQISKNKNYDVNFAGTGSAISDQLGRFSFVTIMPGTKKNDAIFINAKVTLPDQNPIYTKFYLEDKKHPKGVLTAAKFRKTININLKSEFDVALSDELSEKIYMIDFAVSDEVEFSKKTEIKK